MSCTLTKYLIFKNVRVLDQVHIVPAKDRERPYMLELFFTMPAASVAKLSMQFERGFLKWTEHPPDAHHGFYIRYHNDQVLIVNSSIHLIKN